MRPRTRHPRLVDAACTLYGLVIRMYPTGFRRDFGHELAITFRNRAEDVLDAGMVASFAFAVHIAFDWLRTWATWPTEPTVPDSASLLGLREGYMALGSFDRAGVDLTFVAGGFVVACAGYLYFGLIQLWLPA
jgi:hypothetical protein